MRYFEHFSSSEIFTNCSNDEILSCIQHGFLDNLLYLFDFLNDFRDYLDSPIKITSTFRSFGHNKRVGGVEYSQHLIGQAVDFCFPDMPHDTAVCILRDFFHLSAKKSHLGCVIIYDKFIHIGLRTSSHPNFQIYDKRKLEKSN